MVGLEVLHSVIQNVFEASSLPAVPTVTTEDVDGIKYLTGFLISFDVDITMMTKEKIKSTQPGTQIFIEDMSRRRSIQKKEARWNKSAKPNAYPRGGQKLNKKLMFLIEQATYDKNLTEGVHEEAEIVIMAADAEHEEIRALQRLAKKRQVLFVFVPKREALRRACGFPSATACSVGKPTKEQLLLNSLI
ncbi:NHP2 1, partial [Quillaja saponaria]